MDFFITEFHKASKFSVMYYRNNSFSHGKTSKNIRCFPSCFNGVTESHCKDNFCGYAIKCTFTCILTERFDIRGAIFLGEFVLVDKEDDLTVYDSLDDILNTTGSHKNAFLGVIIQSSTFTSASGMQLLSVTTAFNAARKAYVYNEEGSKLIGVEHVFRVSAFHYIFNSGWRCIASGSSPRFSMKCTRRKNSSNDKIRPYRLCGTCGCEFGNRETSLTCACGQPLSPGLVAQPRRFNTNLNLPKCPSGFELIPSLISAHNCVMEKFLSDDSVMTLGLAEVCDDSDFTWTEDFLVQETLTSQVLENREEKHTDSAST
jgi:hypothetical protein